MKHDSDVIGADHWEGDVLAAADWPSWRFAIVLFAVAVAVLGALLR